MIIVLGVDSCDELDRILPKYFLICITRKSGEKEVVLIKINIIKFFDNYIGSIF